MNYDPQPQSLISNIQEQVENKIIFEINAILEELLHVAHRAGRVHFQKDAPPLNSNIKLFNFHNCKKIQLTSYQKTT